MKYKVSVERTFSAAHALRGYKGKCERMHGHTWRVRVTLAGKKLNDIGMLVDFTDLKALLDSVIEKLDHSVINEVPPFIKTNPTAENIAHYVYTTLRGKAPYKNAAVSSVDVWESETSCATVTD